MCNKNSPAPDEGAAKRRSDRIRSKRKRKQAEVSPLKPARRARTKTRKPKYLSLKLELASQEETQKMNQEEEKQQLNLFPLHPENLVEDKDRDYCSHYDTVAAYLFNSTPESTISTIHDLLDTTTTTTTSEECQLSPSLTYGYRDHLVRTAMRSKEREASQEERWVCYSEVVEEKKEQEEVMSSSCGDGAGAANGDAHGDPAVKGKRLALALKLDYQQILNAWSDKGPLYIDGESPLTVPDLHAGGADVVMHGTWAVPEVAGCVGGGFQRSGEWNAKEKLKKGQREASVLRYKEKRQSRLFSKRIRYEVRKLNAEKRPRMKGRFVKIS